MNFRFENITKVEQEVVKIDAASIRESISNEVQRAGKRLGRNTRRIFKIF